MVGDLLSRIKSALGLAARAGEPSLAEQQAEHQAALDKLEEQKRRLAALDAGIVQPRHRGFRL